MHASHFTAFRRFLELAASRRGLFAGLLAGMLAADSDEIVDAPSSGNLRLAQTFIARRNGSAVSFAFPDPPPVEAETVYALVLSRPGVEFISWAFRKDNACNGRSSFSFGQDGPFQQFPNAQVDFTLTTFVRS